MPLPSSFALSPFLPSPSSFPLPLPSPPVLLSPLFPPFPYDLARGFGKRCKLSQRVRAEPGRQTIFDKFIADNNHFDWIFNQVTFKRLHKLIYIERPLNRYVKKSDWRTYRNYFFVIISEEGGGVEPENPRLLPLKYGPANRHFTPIGATVAEISVIRQRKNTTTNIPFDTNVWWITTTKIEHTKPHSRKKRTLPYSVVRLGTLDCCCYSPYVNIEKCIGCCVFCCCVFF